MYFEEKLHATDVLTVIVTSLLIFSGVLMYNRTFPNSIKHKKLFSYGLTAKLIAGQIFALVYTYYYSGEGDTWGYFTTSQKFTQLLIESPTVYIERMLDITQEKVQLFNLNNSYFRYRVGSSEIFLAKIASLLNLASLGSFFGTTLLFSLLSFLGSFKLFELFVRLYPSLSKYAAFCFIFYPSVVFWSSGIMKDTIVIFGLGYFIYHAYCFFEEKKSVFSLIVMILTAVMIFKVKPYVFIILLPCLVIWRALSYRSYIKNKALKIIVLPLLMVGASLVSYYGVIQLGELSPRYSLEKSIQTAQDFQQWHKYLSENNLEGGGSNYDLGNYSPDLLGLLSITPAAINVTLFRPYIWESKNPLMVGSAFESAFLFVITVVIFIRIRPWNIIKFLNKDSFVYSMFIFSLLFAFSVGFSSYNFGALVRYKIPCIPFYVFSLVVIWKMYESHYKKEAVRSYKKRLYQSTNSLT